MLIIPGPKTHDIFYKEIKKKLNNKTLSAMPSYDKYNIFAQGHDFLIYHGFYKIWNQELLNRNIYNSKLLQENNFQDFIYEYLLNAKNNGSIENEQTRLFIGPGYIMHHLLDAYTHPQIIYYAGDHVRDPKNKTWYHGIVENLIDIYLMKELESRDASKEEIYKDFKFNEILNENFINTLTESLYKVYKIKDGGKVFEEAFSDVYKFMKIMKHDPVGLKRIIFDSLDPILKGTSSFSYNNSAEDARKYLNENHEVWLNPMDENFQSTESFMDLFNKALNDGAYILNELESICQSGNIKKSDIQDLIPNIASTHGLECGQTCLIKNKKIW